MCFFHDPATLSATESNTCLCGYILCPSRSIALAEIPPVLQEVEVKEHKLNGLDPKELAELTRKCHLFGSIDLSGWKGVSLMSFRSLGLAVGASLQTVRECGERYQNLSDK